MALEVDAINLVGEIINNSKLPVDKVKSFSINWQYVDGYYFHNIQFEFYETIEKKENADTEPV